MNPQPRTATQLYNRPTFYEIVAKSDSKKLRVAFTARKTRSSLASNLQGNTDALMAEFGIPATAAVSYKKARGFVISWEGGEVALGFSGQTEREFAPAV